MKVLRSFCNYVMPNKHQLSECLKHPAKIEADVDTSIDLQEHPKFFFNMNNFFQFPALIVAFTRNDLSHAIGYAFTHKLTDLIIFVEFLCF